MPLYTATRKLSDVNEANPPGSSPPSELDDALRETRKVMKSVVDNHANDVGCLRSALYFMQDAGATSTATLANNVWWRIPASSTSDPTGLLAAGTYTNSIKTTVAGLFHIEMMVMSRGTNRFQGRISKAVTSVQNPSGDDGTILINTNLGYADSASASILTAHGCGIVSIAPSDSYCMEFINEVPGFFSIAHTLVLTNANYYSPAYARFTLLGKAVT